MRQLLMLASALVLVPAPATAAQQPSLIQNEEEAALAEFRAAVAQLRETMLRPGERVEGWDVGGANPDADIRALGAETHYFLSRGRDGTSVAILTGQPITAFVPSGWRVVDSYASDAGDLPSPQVDFVPLTARYVMGARLQYRRVRDVDCSDNLAEALLFEIPDAPAYPDDEVMPMMFRMVILAMEDQMICVRSEGDRNSGYRSRFFLPDGRLLPELVDPGEVSTIVPAAPIDSLIEPPPPRPEAGSPTG